MRTTIATLSTWTGIHRDTIRRRLAPLLTGERGEQVDSVQALPLIYGDGERLDGAQERARLDRARRESQELANQARRKELIALSDCLKVIDAAAGACREHMMGIPSRWADELAHETDPFVINSILEREIRTALTLVSESKHLFQR